MTGRKYAQFNADEIDDVDFSKYLSNRGNATWSPDKSCFLAVFSRSTPPCAVGKIISTNSEMIERFKDPEDVFFQPDIV